ncbi:unnamed protein product [Ectocarpus sp. 12 AP-2014]
MEVLVLAACGLVANQYVRLKTTGPTKTKPIAQDTQEIVNPETLRKLVKNPDSPNRLGAPSPAPIPLGVRTLKTDHTGDVGHDEARYEEQYRHPQDPNPNVTEKPWMRMLNAPYKPKEEIVSAIPGPQDVFGRDMNSRVKQIETDFATSTVPITSEKQFDRPVEPVATGNGSAIGFHIGAGKRHHKFILNDQPTIESDGGPRGAFSGASGSHVKGDYRTVTQRSSLNHESVGHPVAAGVPQSSAPVPSFEITPSHLESYGLDDHVGKGARAPVQASASTKKSSFKLAHDEKFDVIHTSLATGGERFATGASGNRDTKIHVPLNNDPLATYDQRVVPNFKIAKASDYQDQRVTARQMILPEMSQNVSALRKDKRPPVSGSTMGKNRRLAINTEGVKSGAGGRASTSQPVKVEGDAFKAPADRKVSVAERAALLSAGAAASHSVGGSSSASFSSSLFRTTQSVSEMVSTPFIRGAGSKHASNLEPVHEATDTHLSELESSSLLKGLNKASTAISTSSKSQSQIDQTQKRGDIFKKSERDPVLVSPGSTGTNRTGAANVDRDGLVSLRGLDDQDAAGADNVLRADKLNRRRPGDTSATATTKNRRMGDVLNARLGSSAAMKRLLKNPYALPAASRLSEL